MSKKTLILLGKAISLLMRNNQSALSNTYTVIPTNRVSDLPIVLGKLSSCPTILCYKSDLAKVKAMESRQEIKCQDIRWIVLQDMMDCDYFNEEYLQSSSFVQLTQLKNEYRNCALPDFRELVAYKLTKMLVESDTRSLSKTEELRPAIEDQQILTNSQRERQQEKQKSNSDYSLSVQQLKHLYISIYNTVLQFNWQENEYISDQFVSHALWDMVMHKRINTESNSQQPVSCEKENIPLFIERLHQLTQKDFKVVSNISSGNISSGNISPNNISSGNIPFKLIYEGRESDNRVTIYS